MFTLARVLLQQTHQYLPSENLDYMCPLPSGSPLSQNPLVHRIFEAVYDDDRTVLVIQNDTWHVWYPLDAPINLEKVNRRLKRQGSLSGGISAIEIDLKEEADK